MRLEKKGKKKPSETIPKESESVSVIQREEICNYDEGISGDDIDDWEDLDSDGEVEEDVFS